MRNILAYVEKYIKNLKTFFFFNLIFITIGYGIYKKSD